MKITIDRDELADLLASASAVVPARTTRPILEYVLLVAEKGRAEFFATDLDVSLRLRAQRCDVAAPGRALLPAKKALALVKSFDGAKVTVATSGENGEDVTLDDGASRFTLRGPGGFVFPALALDHAEPEVWLPTSLLVGGIRKVAFAAAEEGGEYGRRAFAVAGVNVGRKGARLRIATTDGVAVARYYQEIEEGRDIDHTISLKAARILENISAGAERLGLTFADSATTITAGDSATLKAPKFTSPFPDLDKMQIDVSGHTSFDVDRAKLLSALRRLALIVEGKKTHAVLLSLARGGVSVSGIDTSAEGRSDVACAYDGAPLEVGANVRMMAAALDAIDSEKVTVRLRAVVDGRAGGPIVVEDGAGWQYMLMPIDHVGYAAEREAEKKPKKEKADAAAS